MNFRPALALMLAPLLPATSPAQDFFVYFGTYTGPSSQGIYRARFDAATGRLSPAALAAEISNPAFLALHPTKNILYALDENSAPARNPDSGLSAFAIDPASGALRLLNRQTAGGAAPCHLSVGPTGDCLLVANYTGGNVAAVRLAPDGRLGALGTVAQHTGSSVNASRQQAPHAHSIYPAPDGRFALAADLGIDRVLVYRLDPATATLSPATPPSAPLPPGSGPRHLAFHPDGRFVYVLNELLCTMVVFRFDPASGALTALQTLSTLPPGESVKPAYSTAEVYAHPHGKFLYASNRGHNSIVVFAIDPATGRLTHVENQPTRGRTPRHFALDPTGAWLLAENQDSNDVAVFRLDSATGRLAPAGPLVPVPSPVCAVFVAAR